MAKDPLLTAKVGRIDLIEVPPIIYFTVDGQGAPGSEAYVAAIEALYSVAYGARFHGKTLGHEEKVGPLEGLWWADDYTAYTEGRRDEWRWSMMIRTPSWMNDTSLDDLRDVALKKRADKPLTVQALCGLELRLIDEGQCLQALHIGPYTDEAPLIARMHNEAMPEHGVVPNGLHHEIYLSDARRVAPEKLRTLLRQPVRAA